MEDSCLYMKKETNGSPIILVLYVEDMLIAGKPKTTLQELKCKLKSALSMKDIRKTLHGRFLIWPALAFDLHFITRDGSKL